MRKHTLTAYRKLIRLFGLFGLLSVFLFPSCEDLQADESEEKSLSSSKTYTVSFKVADAAEDSSSELQRNIYPSKIIVGGLSFLLQGEPIMPPEGYELPAADSETPVDWTGWTKDESRTMDGDTKLLNGIQYPTKEELDKASFNLDSGAWKFLLKAYSNDAYRATDGNGAYTYKGEYSAGDLRLTAVSYVREITAGNNVITFNMTLADDIPDEYKYGSIKLVLNCYLGDNTCSVVGNEKDSDKGITVSLTKYKDKNSETIDDTFNYANIVKTITVGEPTNDASGKVYTPVTYETENTIPKGEYSIFVKIPLVYGKDSGGNPKQTFATFKDTEVVVETGSQSYLNKNLTDLRQRYTIEYKSVEVTHNAQTEADEYRVEDFSYFNEEVDVFEYNPSSKTEVVLPEIVSMTRDDKVFLGWYDSYVETTHKFGKEADRFSPTGLTGTITFWAQWGDLDIYVSEDGDDKTGNGSLTSPYKTLTQAIARIREYPNTNLEWTIYIMGSVTAGTEIKSSGDSAISARKITITGYNTKGKSDNWVGADGLVTSTDEKAVVDVNTNFPVEFSYLTINHNYVYDSEKNTDRLATGNGLVFGTSDMNTDIKVDNVKVFDNVVSQTGGAGISNFMNLTLTNCEISGNYAKEMANNGGAGGGIYSHKKLSLENCLIKSNSASKGGGIYNSNMLELNNCEFISNSVSSGTGGAIHTENSVTISGCKFESNTAGTQGGAIYSTVTGSTTLLPVGGVKVKITGTSFTSNTATSAGGGAIAVYNYGSNSLEIILNSGVVIGGENAGNSSNQGGGIYIQGYSNNTSLTIPEDAVGVKVSYNEASQGAGIYVSCSELNINNGSISCNTASESGGGVYLMDSTVVIDGTVSGNKAQNGAGVYCVNSTFTLTGTLDSNEASGNGGGIYINNGFGAENAIYAINDGAFISNNKAENGGGVYCASEYGSIPVFEMQGGSITENKASSGNGGGVYISGYSYESLSSPFIFRMTKGSISGNSASVSGGGVYIDKSAEMFMSGSAVVGKGASKTATSEGYSNKASNGGGIYNDGKLYLGYDAEITTVESTTTVTPAISTLGNAVLYNFATTKGGGIYNAGEFYFASGSVGYNATETSGYGGGIYNSGNVYMHGDACVGFANTTTFATVDTASNIAGYGGGICNENKYLIGYSDSDTIDSNFSGGIYFNTATFGGGIFNENNNSVLKMAAGYVAWNFSSGKATASAGGGGVYHKAGNFYFFGGAICNNKATAYGGGVDTAGNMFMYGTATIGEKNADPTAVATKTNCSNIARNGGGIYNTGELYLGYSDISSEGKLQEAELQTGVYYNYATDSEEGGGAIYNAKNVKIKSGEILQNSANADEDYTGKKGIVTAENTATTEITEDLISNGSVQSD